MNRKTSFLVFFTALYLFLFTFWAILGKNYEFLYYIIILIILCLILILYHKPLLTKYIAMGLTGVALLHLFGGFWKIHGIRLYDWYLFSGFRYDNLMHVSASFVAAFVCYNLLKPHLAEHIRFNTFFMSFILIAMVCGIGAFSEIIELGAVVFLGAAKEVGGYMNNALDLVFNFLGAALACLCLYLYRRFQSKRMEM